MAHAGGRPPIWEDPIKFEQAVDEYFAQKDEIHTWTGLALYLGFAGRDSLNDYLKKPEFFHSVRKSLSRVENIYEKALFKGNPAGPIFALKNFGWKDKQEVEQSGGIKFSFAEPEEYKAIYPSEDQGNIGESDSIQ